MPQYPIHGSKYFDTREFVDQKTWKMLGIKSAWLIDPKIVRICDLLREKTGVPVVVNNWHYAKSGSIYKASGFRAKWETVGAELSQHRTGRAADVKVSGMKPAQVVNLIIAHQTAFMDAGLTTIEAIAYTPTWTHLDCRPILDGISAEGGLLFVQP